MSQTRLAFTKKVSGLDCLCQHCLAQRFEFGGEGLNPRDRGGGDLCAHGREGLEAFDRKAAIARAATSAATSSGRLPAQRLTMKTAVPMALRAIKCRSGEMVVRGFILAVSLPSEGFDRVPLNERLQVGGREPRAATDANMT
jgi:hypothetical protein